MAAVVGVKHENAGYAEVEPADGRRAATGADIGAGPVPCRLEYEPATGPRYATQALSVRSRGSDALSPGVFRYESEGSETDPFFGSGGLSMRYAGLADQVITP
jgi:hypothetical protein